MRILSVTMGGPGNNLSEGNATRIADSKSIINYIYKNLPLFQTEGAQCNLLFYLMCVLTKFTFYFTKLGNLNIFFNQRKNIVQSMLEFFIGLLQTFENYRNNKEPDTEKDESSQKEMKENKQKMNIEEVNNLIKKIVESIEESPSSGFWGYNVFINEYPIKKVNDISWD